MSNHARTAFYIGVTSDLQHRVLQHKTGKGGTFTSTYKCHYLMHFETYGFNTEAIAREKALKNWHREWKINLIRKENPLLDDLAQDW